MVEVRPLGLDGVIEISTAQIRRRPRVLLGNLQCPKFCELSAFSQTFVQDNHSLSTAAGVLRGLHYQLPPKAQDKLVRVVRGRVFDVAVDIRKGSPDIRKMGGARALRREMEPDSCAGRLCARVRHARSEYRGSLQSHGILLASHDRSIRFDDPRIGIQWPIDTSRLQLSAKDQAAPLLADADTFRFQRNGGMSECGFW